jgi:cytochrome c oxidase subunit 2
MKVTWLPYEDSSYAPHVDAIFISLLILCSLVTLVVFALIIWFSVRYRKGSQADRTYHMSDDIEFRIELTWILIPFFIFLGLFVWAGNVYYEMYSPPRDGLPIYVVAKQWMWEIEHPEGQREINQLHIPAGRDIVLTMTSQDVIHDFDVPAFRIKHDVLPGRYVRMWFRATTPGSYRLFCGQYCGDFHSQMVGEIVVMKPVDYAHWLQTSSIGVSSTLASEGSAWFHSLGCSGCHEGSSVVHAPSLAGLYDQPVPLQSGAMVTADDNYLRDSILQPGKQIPAGYQPIMPTYQGTLSEEQVISLIAYIKSLSPSAPAPDRSNP